MQFFIRKFGLIYFKILEQIEESSDNLRKIKTRNKELEEVNRNFQATATKNNDLKKKVIICLIKGYLVLNF